MLGRLVADDGIALAVLKPGLLTAEVAREIAVRTPEAVVVGSVPPGGLAETRHLCKRLAAMVPEPQILAARWGQQTADGEEGAPGGVLPVVGSLAEAPAHLGRVVGDRRRTRFAA